MLDGNSFNDLCWRIYWVIFSCKTDQRRPNAPPDDLPALRPTPYFG
jgi:hypothetical protein